MLQALGDVFLSCVLIQINDLLAYAKDFDELKEELNEELEKIEIRKAQCQAELLKTDICALIIAWCGRRLQRMASDSEFVKGLLGLPEPKTAADLQNFLAGANWARSSIPSFTETTAPLQGWFQD